LGVVEKMKCSNVGLCIDTLHVAAIERVNLTRARGQHEEPSAVERFKMSTKRLTDEVFPNKIFPT
jgi:hypothetical protein